ncbi:MAG TPA: peptidoglycan editing factor PgeF, partial [Candidatus Binatia bacterium]
LRHGFLGRAHGLGAGTFDLATIRDRLIQAGECADAVLAARQVHGAHVLSPEHPAFAHLDWADRGEHLPAADALVTASAGVLLTIRTADCVPVLLVAPGSRAVAAVHAGWRGALAGVVENAVAALAERYGARPAAIQAAIGPAIGGCCYEFGVEHFVGFVSRYGEEARAAWTPPGADPARGHLDVRTLVDLALRRSGLDPAAIHAVGPCTAEVPETLHSYRRDGPHAGRQLSYVGWQPA